MIERHPLLETPTDDTVIWRYLDLHKYLDLLVCKALRFSNPSVFDDRFEGSLSSPALTKLAASFRDFGNEPAQIGMARSILAEARRIYPQFFVNCWHIRPDESTSMWKSYSAAGSGLALKSTIGRVKAAFTANKRHKIYIGKVRYVNFESSEFKHYGDRGPVNQFVPLFNKRHFFEDEKELRLLFWAHDEFSPHEEALKAQQDKFINIPVEPDVLIEEVVISPCAPESLFKVVDEVTALFGHSRLGVTQSALLGDPIR